MVLHCGGLACGLTGRHPSVVKIVGAEKGHEYRGLVASTWDAFRGDTSNWPDRGFYLEAIRRYGQPVLDVGCGTGRLLIDYASQGIDIDGVDISPEMLDLCRDKAARSGISVTLFQQRMEDLELPRRYRCILVPSSSFQLLLDPEGAVRAMVRLFNQLEPGGALLMPFMTLWRQGEPLETEWTKEAVRPADGATLRRHSAARFDPTTGLEHTEDRFEVLLDGRVVESEHHVRSPATRSYTQDEAISLCERSGFNRVQLYGEFVWEPVTPDASVFCVLGIRP
jgi:ubiquinone/menaquinone biosynthesis C-methylase UbiE